MFTWRLTDKAPDHKAFSVDVESPWLYEPIKACADKLVREIEMFGPNFEWCPAERFDEVSQRTPRLPPLQKHIGRSQKRDHG
jgi:hypothetical protein